MNTDSLVSQSLPSELSHQQQATPTSVKEQVVAYYDAATADYAAWSKGFNMHFGYWRLGMNPFDREAMLDEINLQLLSRLKLPRDKAARLADLGGGTGATARTAVATYSNLSVDVVTISEVQIEVGRRLNASSPRGDAIAMHCTDFAATELPGGAYDAVCMVESACHAEGPTKNAVLREAHRLLKPGGHLIMVDAMLLRPMSEKGVLGRFSSHLYRRWCLSWAVPEMCRRDLLPTALEKEGMEMLKFENWSANVIPSVAHVPLFAAYFALAEIIKAKGILPMWRWRHIVASFLTPLLGLQRRTFVYGAMIARKPTDEKCGEGH